MKLVKSKLPEERGVRLRSRDSVFAFAFPKTFFVHFSHLLSRSCDSCQERAICFTFRGKTAVSLKAGDIGDLARASATEKKSAEMSAHAQQVTEQDLLTILASTLSPSNEQRQAAEAQLAQVQETSASCFVALTHLILNPSYPLELRQAAAISLRPLILRKWSPFFEKFEGYGSGTNGEALSLDIKHGVRGGLLQALICPERKIRLAASNALAAVASPDFPDQFPELLPFIKANLQQQQQGGSIDTVHGTMIFLSDFVRSELDENQLMSVAQEILPSLEALLMDKQVRELLRSRSDA